MTSIKKAIINEYLKTTDGADEIWRNAPEVPDWKVFESNYPSTFYVKWRGENHFMNEVYRVNDTVLNKLMTYLKSNRITLTQRNIVLRNYVLPCYELALADNQKHLDVRVCTPLDNDIEYVKAWFDGVMKYIISDAGSIKTTEPVRRVYFAHNPKRYLETGDPQYLEYIGFGVFKSNPITDNDGIYSITSYKPNSVDTPFISSKDIIYYKLEHESVQEHPGHYLASTLGISVSPRTMATLSWFKIEAKLNPGENLEQDEEEEQV